MARFDDRRAAFRAVFDGGDCVHPASVFDPVSARIAQQLGFETGMFAGSVAALTVLGAPDHILLTLSEFAGQAERICRACDLPLMVDADHGYGNALNVMRTVQELENAGVAGLSIEDTDLPPAHGSSAPQLVSIDEGVGKMRAALEARCDAALLIAGRTSAAALTGVGDAIARVTAYQDAGVDAIFLVGVKTRADFDAIAADVKVPLIMGSFGAELDDISYLTDRGARLALQGHQPVAAGYLAVHETLKAMRAGTPPGDLAGVPGARFMAGAIDEARYADWIKRFL